MVPFGLGEPPQSLLLGQVVAFAHGLFSLPRVLHHTECKSVGAGVRLSERRGQRALPVNFAFWGFCELRVDGVFRSWLRGSAGGIMLVEEGDIPRSLKWESPVVDLI